MCVRLLLPCIYYTIGGPDLTETNIEGSKGAQFQEEEKALFRRIEGDGLKGRKEL
jgi:hypothetical protein